MNEQLQQIAADAAELREKFSSYAPDLARLAALVEKLAQLATTPGE